MKRARQHRRNTRWSALASIAAAFALFPLCAAAGSPSLPAAKLLCNQGRVVCVPASLPNSLISNPLTVDVQIDSPATIDVDWELRDSSGRTLDFGSTEDRPDWPGSSASPHRTLHLMDFILRPAASQQGTLILSPSCREGSDAGDDLPQLAIPVRLSTARSVVTILEPEDPNRFHDDIYSWANSHLSTDPTPYHTDIPFAAHRVEVMAFEPRVAVGITAAVILDRYRGESPWRLTHWYRVGRTAHVGMQGSGWSGVGNYVSMLNYVLRRSMLSIPGIDNYVYDR